MIDNPFVIPTYFILRHIYGCLRGDMLNWRLYLTFSEKKVNCISPYKISEIYSFQ